MTRRSQHPPQCRPPGMKGQGGHHHAPRQGRPSMESTHAHFPESDSEGSSSSATLPVHPDDMVFEGESLGARHTHNGGYGIPSGRSSQGFPHAPRDHELDEMDELTRDLYLGQYERHVRDRTGEAGGNRRGARGRGGSMSRHNRNGIPPRDGASAYFAAFDCVLESRAYDRVMEAERATRRDDRPTTHMGPNGELIILDQSHGMGQPTRGGHMMGYEDGAFDYQPTGLHGGHYRPSGGRGGRSGRR